MPDPLNTSPGEKDNPLRAQRGEGNEKKEKCAV